MAGNTADIKTYSDLKIAGTGAILALISSEILKKSASDRHLAISSDMRALIEKALKVLFKDQEANKFRIKGEESVRVSGLGLIERKLAGDIGEHEISSDDEIEGFKEGVSRKRTADISKVNCHLPYEYECFAENIDFAVRTLEKALAKGSINMLEAERTARALSYLSAPAARRLSMGSGDEEGEMLLELSKQMDEKIKTDPFAVSRRLTMKYFGPSSLDELDGHLRLNIIDGKKTEIPMMDGLSYITDPESGMRMLSLDGRTEFLERVKRLNFRESMMILAFKLSRDRKSYAPSMEKDAQVDVSIEKDDFTLLWNAFMKEGKIEEKSEETEKAIEFLSSIIFHDNRKHSALEVRERISQISSELPVYTLSELDKKDGIEEQRRVYEELFDAAQALKNTIIGAAIAASYDGRNNEDFPYDGAVPALAEMHLGKKISMLEESRFSIARLNSLPLSYIREGKEKDRILSVQRKLLERAEIAGKRAERDIKENFLDKDDDEIRKDIEDAIGDRPMKGDEKGWFTDKPALKSKYMKILTEAVTDSLASLAELPDEIARKAIYEIESSPRSPIPAGGRKTYDAMDDGGSYRELKAPDPEVLIREQRTDIIMRIFACTSIDAALDLAVRSGEDAYYSDSVSLRRNIAAVLSAKLSGCDAGRFSGKKGQALEAQKSALQMIRGITEAVKSAGGKDEECVKIMERAEEKARALFIESYLDEIKTAKEALRLQGVAEEKTSLMGCIREEAEELGKRYVRRIAYDALEMAGCKEEAESLYKDKKLKPSAAYALSLAASATASSAMKKADMDMCYYEIKNSEESFWLDEENVQKDAKSYPALSKGIMPYISDDDLRKEIMRQIEEPEIAEELSTMMAADRELGGKALDAYAESIDKRKEEQRREAYRYQNADPEFVEPYWKSIDHLKATIIHATIGKTEEELRKEIREEMGPITEEIAGRGFDEVLEKAKAFSEKVMEMDHIYRHDLITLAMDADELKYLSPFTLYNRKCSMTSSGRSYLLSWEKENVKKLYDEGVKEREYLEKEIIDSEPYGVITGSEIARINASFAGLFSEESALTKAFAEEIYKEGECKGDDYASLYRELKSAKILLDEELEKEFLQSYIAGAEKCLRRDITASENGIESERVKAYRVALQDGTAEAELPKAPLLMAMKVPDGSGIRRITVRTDEGDRERLLKEGFTSTDDSIMQHGLRNGLFAKAIGAKGAKRRYEENGIKAVYDDYFGFSHLYNEALRKSARGNEFTKLYEYSDRERSAGSAVRNSLYGIKDDKGEAIYSFKNLEAGRKDRNLWAKVQQHYINEIVRLTREAEERKERQKREGVRTL